MTNQALEPAVPRQLFAQTQADPWLITTYVINGGVDADKLNIFGSFDTYITHILTGDMRDPKLLIAIAHKSKADATRYHTRSAYKLLARPPDIKTCAECSAKFLLKFNYKGWFRTNGPGAYCPKCALGTVWAKEAMRERLDTDLVYHLVYMKIFDLEGRTIVDTEQML